jgi:hypothetical protein
MPSFVEGSELFGEQRQSGLHSLAALFTQPGHVSGSCLYIMVECAGLDDNLAFNSRQLCRDATIACCKCLISERS